MKYRMAGIGNRAIPNVPLKDFHKLNVKIDFGDVWHICGPSAERNLASMPLWKVICAAYLEGLQHGNEIKELQE